MGNLQPNQGILCKYTGFDMINRVIGVNIKIYIPNISVDTQNMLVDGLNIDSLNINICIHLDKYSKCFW